jgi:acyl transferase domain-containing protein
VIGGALPYEIGLDLVVTRARLLQSDPTHLGGMAIVGTSQERVLHIIHELGLDNRLVIAVYNGPESHVISGEIKAIDTFLSTASIRGFRAAKVNVDQGRLLIINVYLFHISELRSGFHSPFISSALPALQEWLNEHRHLFTPLNIPLYSTVYGKEIRGDQRLTLDYWVRTRYSWCQSIS